MTSIENQRIKAISHQLSREDLTELEQNRPVYLGGLGMVMPEDLKNLDTTCPEWRRRFEDSSGKPATARKHPPDKPAAKENPLSAEISRHLPVWRDDERGCSSSIFRSALFGIVRKGRRKAFEKVLIASLGNIRIIFTGFQLDQADLDVYLYCLHIARHSPLGKPIPLNVKAFLKAIGRSTGKSDREWLMRSIARLTANLVEIQIDLGDRRVTYAGSLVNEYYFDDKEGKYLIFINPKTAALFDGGLWVSLDWEIRKTLKGHPLAQWLHAFYSTHGEPYPYKVETIRKLCGSDIKNLYDFRIKLKKALNAVSSATGWKMWIDENDCLRVEKPAET